MNEREREDAIREFESLVGDKTFPCVAAKGAMSRKHIDFLVLDAFDCPEDDRSILAFLYDFILKFREQKGSFYSAVLLFRHPSVLTEAKFDEILWKKLQHLADLDAESFSHDQRVSRDPSSPHFSFSLGEEAFFIIGLHGASSRRARRLRFPAIVFNPHVQFEDLRKANRYEKMKKIVRQRDQRYSGSTNPMLSDFGERSEAHQYSGRVYDPDWQCPFRAPHADAPESLPTVASGGPDPSEAR